MTFPRVVSELDVCKLREFPWVPRVPWDSHGNGNVVAPFVRMGKNGNDRVGMEGNGNSASLENSHILGYVKYFCNVLLFVVRYVAYS